MRLTEDPALSLQTGIARVRRPGEGPNCTTLALRHPPRLANFSPVRMHFSSVRGRGVGASKINYLARCSTIALRIAVYIAQSNTSGTSTVWSRNTTIRSMMCCVAWLACSRSVAR